MTEILHVNPIEDALKVASEASARCETLEAQILAAPHPAVVVAGVTGGVLGALVNERGLRYGLDQANFLRLALDTTIRRMQQELHEETHNVQAP